MYVPYQSFCQKRMVFLHLAKIQFLAVSLSYRIYQMVCLANLSHHVDADLQGKTSRILTLVYCNRNPHKMKARAKRCAVSASMDTRILKVRAMQLVGRVPFCCAARTIKCKQLVIVRLVVEKRTRNNVGLHIFPFNTSSLLLSYIS